MLELSSRLSVQSYLYNIWKAIRSPTSCLLAQVWYSSGSDVTIMSLDKLFVPLCPPALT